jgi:hypothetical protein
MMRRLLHYAPGLTTIKKAEPKPYFFHTAAEILKSQYAAKSDCIQK